MVVPGCNGTEVRYGTSSVLSTVSAVLKSEMAVQGVECELYAHVPQPTELSAHTLPNSTELAYGAVLSSRMLAYGA
eukprot:1237457-Rhodomonas_salina.1